jgi:hypothetical protein
MYIPELNRNISNSPPYLYIGHSNVTGGKSINSELQSILCVKILIVLYSNLLVPLKFSVVVSSVATLA